jgi:hypothetical protein
VILKSKALRTKGSRQAPGRKAMDLRSQPLGKLSDRDPTVLHKLGRAKRQEQRCQTARPEENLRQRSHSPYTFIGHSRHHDPTKHPRRSSLPAPSDPRPRTGQQSIPIGHALGNGLVQPIFRPPSRRPPSDCSPSVFRRDAGLKMLCVMLQSGDGQGTVKL